MTEKSGNFVRMWTRLKEISLEVSNLNEERIGTILSKIEGKSEYSILSSRLSEINRFFKEQEVPDIDKIIPMIEEMNVIYKDSLAILEASDMEKNNSELVVEFIDLKEKCRERLELVQKSLKV
jgi:hypothetical protein